MKLLACTLISSLLAVDAGGQGHAAHTAASGSASTGELLAFVSAARAGAERYGNRNDAIAAGFRPLGRDFPSMGEHWVNPGKVIAGRFDLADPAMLIYATIDGKPVLLGVVFAIPLEAGQPLPPLPGGLQAWHEHNGTVDEESFLPEHGGGHSPTRLAGTRLAILHVWTLLPNPAGYLAAENWSLPFARLHLAAPATIPEPAARALSLVSGSGDFYANLFETEFSSVAGDEWHQALAAAIDGARAIVSARDAKDALSGAEISALGELWTRFTASISVRSPALAQRLRGEKRDGEAP